MIAYYVSADVPDRTTWSLYSEEVIDLGESGLVVVEGSQRHISRHGSLEEAEAEAWRRGTASSNAGQEVGA